MSDTKSGTPRQSNVRKVTRRQLVSTLTAVAAGTTAAVTASTASAQATSTVGTTADGSIQRYQKIPGLAVPGVPYSEIVATTRPRTIYVAAQLPRGPKGVVGKGDIRAQMRQVGENVKAALATAGATLEDLVEITTYITSWTEFRKATDVREEYFGKFLPTSTTFQVVALASPDYMIQVSAVAVVNK